MNSNSVSQINLNSVNVLPPLISVEKHSSVADISKFYLNNTFQEDNDAGNKKLLKESGFVKHAGGNNKSEIPL